MPEPLAAALARLTEPIVDDRNGLAVHSVAEIGPELRSRMFKLLQSCYEHVTEAQFELDLSEKEWAIVGVDRNSGNVWCFSTLKRIYLDESGGRMVAFYSGDTASRADTRGGATAAGTRLVVRKMFSEIALHPEKAYYWFMISSTYKSFRLLSALFSDFAPGPERPLTNDERRRLSALSRIRGFDYDPVLSVVRFRNASVPRDDGSTDEAVKRSDHMAAFFAAANPGAATGERLASLTRLSLENLTPLGLKFVLGPDADCE